ncbi:sirohydrochlorin chelatase [Cytobacillus kochii]|uniref:sirohydrochlorin chelatase n=1 Tax=Cytobacillus kochii TaxID=859143 RepID=UPI001CD38B49|nr:sirohydrochlorin chelatase [Cytobacillus kochii]MCA1026016.1 sirohydrochlorin chelatase [Cytobacillus kochii]
MKAILYIAHGTRSKKGIREVECFLQTIMKQVNVPIQEWSYLEICAPTIEQGIEACVHQGAREIEIIPLLLLKGGHYKKDIPGLLLSLQRRFSAIKIDLLPPFGVQSYILDGICDLINEKYSPITEKDHLLVVGRGSSDMNIYKDFNLITTGLKARLAVNNVTSCFLAAATPRLEEGYHLSQSRTKNRVIIIPYLLFSGLLLDELQQFTEQKRALGDQTFIIEPLSRISSIQLRLIQYLNKGGPEDCNHSLLI